MQPEGMPPAAALMQRLTGAWIAQSISVVAKLGTADALADGPRHVSELAAMANVHAPSLYRLLRTLASFGIFAEDEDGRFRLTPLADPLRSDAPDSVRAYAIMLGEEWVWRAWGNALHSVQTGESAFEYTFGVDPWEYLAARPEASAIFDAAMTSRSGRDNDAVAAAYDFSGCERIVDVAGGRGSLLAAILRAYPALHGTLFDQPHVAPGAQEYLAAAGLADRCDVVAGDFFASIPPGADAYLLKRVIHDWDDERAVRILRHCREAMPPTGRLLVIETVIPPGNGPSIGKVLDLQMLVHQGGKERTEAEYRALLTDAGFDLTQVVPTSSALSLIEGVPQGR